MLKNPPSNAVDEREMGSVPGLGRFPGGGTRNPLQYSRLENSKDRGAWLATVHGGCKESGVTERTDTHTHTLYIFIHYYICKILYIYTQIQWHIIQSSERRKFHHSQHQGWTWSTLCPVREVRERKILYNITYM